MCARPQQTARCHTAETEHVASYVTDALWHVCVHACMHAEQHTIGYIAVSGDPATVGCAPVHIIWLDIKDILGGEGRPHHVPPCGVLHPLGLAC